MSYFKGITAEKLDWLEKRRTGVGGSDAAALLGVNKYKTRLKVWREKVNGYDPADLEDNKYTEAGTRFENSLREWACDRLKLKIVRSHQQHRHKDFPFMIANVDGLVQGEPAIFEAKTTGSRFALDSELSGWGPEGSDEVPFLYQAQCQHYMIVLKRQVCYLGVFFFLEREFCLYRLELNRDLEKSLVNAEETFWKMVSLKEPPPPETIKELHDWYPVGYPEQVTASEEVTKLVREIQRLKQRIKTEQKSLDEVMFQVKQYMEDYAELVNQFRDPVATWKSQQVARFNVGRFKKDYPELAEEYTDTTTQRKFLVKTHAR